MKENKYDDNIFFQKYSQMSRSQQGLAGAGEWETLRKLLPDFKDKRVLDLGCGYGWHCIYAMEHGASSVVGVDISHKMLEVAKEKTHFPQVEYKCCAIEDVEFPEESFDVILSSLAFHYVADYEILVKKIYRILKSGGKLVFTVEHPVFTAYGTQDWHYNEKGEILHFPVDNYYYEGKRTGAEPNSTVRGLALIEASPIIRPSPSTVNTIFSFARRRTLPLSSVTSATTTIKSEPSATNCFPSVSTYIRNFVLRRDGIRL